MPIEEGPITDGEFQSKFSEFVCGSDERVRILANYMLVSTKTIQRWCDGRNLPHPAIRRQLVEALARIP